MYIITEYIIGGAFFGISNKLIMIILLDSGIRNTELCDVRMEDIRENNTIFIIDG